MQYERIYADPRGKTHFGQVSLKLDEADYQPSAPMLFVSHAIRAGMLQFIRLPAGWVGENICPPQHQFFICLQGELDAVDAILMEDSSGCGHNSPVKDAKDLIAAIVSFEW